MSATITIPDMIVKLNATFNLQLIVNPGGVALGSVQCVLATSGAAVKLVSATAGDSQFNSTPTYNVGANGSMLLLNQNVSSLTLPTQELIVARITGTAGSKTGNCTIAPIRVEVLDTGGTAIPLGQVYSCSMRIIRK